MPRHTHPKARAKHSRTHLREQRARFIRRNWQRGKKRYDYRGWSIHPEVARRNPDAPNAFWPFTLEANRLTRNPFNLCSCAMCSITPAARRLRRRQENRWLVHDIQEQIEEIDEFYPRTAHHHGQPPKVGAW